MIDLQIGGPHFGAWQWAYDFQTLITGLFALVAGISAFVSSLIMAKAAETAANKQAAAVLTQVEVDRIARDADIERTDVEKRNRDTARVAAASLLLEIPTRASAGAVWYVIESYELLIDASATGEVADSKALVTSQVRDMDQSIVALDEALAWARAILVDLPPQHQRGLATQMWHIHRICGDVKLNRNAICDSLANHALIDAANISLMKARHQRLVTCADILLAASVDGSFDNAAARFHFGVQLLQ